LANPVASFNAAMTALRPLAPIVDPRIPRMLDGSDEEGDVLRWLLSAESNDRWVALVADAFLAAGAGSLRIGTRVTVDPFALKRALNALDDKDHVDGLHVVDGRVKGPRGELFSVFVPPLAGGTTDCPPRYPDDAYNADNFLTADEPTSDAQTAGGKDPGWSIVGKPLIDIVALRHHDGWLTAAAIATPRQALEGKPEQAGRDRYEKLVGELRGDSGQSEPPEPEELPPDNPYLTSRDHYTPPPDISMPGFPRQETGEAGVGALRLGVDAASNVADLDNGELGVCNVTFERNIDGRTRAVVRLYQQEKLPDSEWVTHVSYGSPNDDGTWQLKPLKVRQPGPYPSAGPP
jgi:hypothetical protein